MAVDSWTLFSKLISCQTLRTMYIWGPPGIGKTYGAYTEGLDGRELYSVTMTEDTPAAELRGFYIPKGGDFVWADGPAVMSMRKGGRLVINEVSHAGPDVRSILYGIMESPDTARLTLPTGETVRPKEGFQVILTDNCPPTDLPQALQDRFDSVVSLEEPSPKAVNGFPENMREIVVRCARDAKRRVSLRSWETLERLMNGGLDFDLCGIATFGAERWSGLKTSIKVAMGKAVAGEEEKVPAEQVPVPEPSLRMAIQAGDGVTIKAIKYDLGSMLKFGSFAGGALEVVEFMDTLGRITKIPLYMGEKLGRETTAHAVEIVSMDGMVRSVGTSSGRIPVPEYRHS